MCDVTPVSITTMVRFSCFNAHIHSHKPKKTSEPSVEAMHKTLQDSSQIQAPPKTSHKATSLNLSFPEAQVDAQISDGAKDVTNSVSMDRSWKSDEIKGNLNTGSDIGVHQTGFLKKSQSLGSGLCLEGRVFCDNDTEEEIDQGLSSDSLDQYGLVGPDGSKDPGISPTSLHKKSLQSESVQVNSDLVSKEPIFSISDPQHSEKEGPENSETLLSGEVANESGNNTPRTLPVIVKSHSMPNIGPSALTSGGCSYKPLAPRSRSSDDLRVLDMRWKEISIHKAETQILQEQHTDNACKTEKNNFANSLDDGYDSCNYSALAKDWIVPVMNEVNLSKNLQGESSIQRDESTSKDFKIKRIEEWVNDLQHCSPLDETNGLSDNDNPVKRDSMVPNGLTAAKVDNKVTPGMEAAKRYISSLSVSAATAQLSNHGLAVIPFLSAFVSLRVLNLSGNSIVRITAGALPRGLHVLNLSKNSISTIEGLRELTRLRVLDLSYNRIFRIGHGLASCSSLKELYLAGNKISEVEGLHRLLKLTVLDLRFNKISTAKCLGQLAANYNSLQAISLEGNPAQKNVGDEQLKKYLQGLLPHLVYFNRQPIKVSTLKDAADRSVRLGIGAHQFDRGLRSDNKAARKASHSLAGPKPSSSSAHVRKSQAVISPKRSKGRHVRLPPSGSKATTSHRHQYFDLGSKLLNFRSELSIRRSRSEGTLGAL